MGKLLLEKLIQLILHPSIYYNINSDKIHAIFKKKLISYMPSINKNDSCCTVCQADFLTNA